MEAKGPKQKSVKGQLVEEFADYKWFVSNKDFVNDHCTCLKGLQTAVRQNGTGFLSAVVRSHKANHTWHIQVILCSANHATLGWSPYFELPIAEAHTEYEYNRLGFTYDAAKYASVAYILWRYWCG